MEESDTIVAGDVPASEHTEKVQQELPLSRPQKLELLRKARLPLSRREVHNVRRLLEKIEVHMTRGRTFTKQFLSEVMDRSERSVQRYIAMAEEIGVLTVDRSPRTSGGQGANVYAVQWEQLRSYGAPQRRLTDCLPPETNCLPPRTNRLPPETNCLPDTLVYPRARIPSFIPSSIPSSSTTKQPRSLDSSSTGPAFDSSSPNWEVVVVDLLRLGLTDARNCVRQAQQHGVSPAEVQALADHYNATPGAWKIGALHFRVRNAFPGQPADEAWPKPSEAYLAAKLRDEANAHAQQQQREQRERDAKLAAEREREAQLEAAFGPVLNGLCSADLANLVDRVIGGNPILLGMYRAEGCASAGLVRCELLEALAKESLQARQP